jgi:folate-binding protein YgfZ
MMSEATEQAGLERASLDETHRRLGARTEERDGMVVPAAYGDTAKEYDAVRGGGTGVIDLSSRARINVSGSEAVQFLNGLVTNDVKALAEGAWMYAAFPNVQGRLLAMVRVLHRDSGFLFDTEASSREAVLKTLNRFTLAGDFHVSELTGDLATLSVQGAGASDVIGRVLGREAAQVGRGQIIETTHDEEQLSVIRATHTAEDGYDLFITGPRAADVWNSLMAAGAQPVGHDALELLRIEAGVPRFGLDVNETNVMLEAGLDDAVSYTKGCYIGQEIIARIHWRGHVAKRLAGIRFEDAPMIEREDRVRTIDGKEIGRVTSTAFSPALNAQVALAMIKYDYLTPGTEVAVTSGDVTHAAVVSGLPLMRGSWYQDEAALQEE